MTFFNLPTFLEQDNSSLRHFLEVLLVMCSMLTMSSNAVLSKHIRFRILVEVARAAASGANNLGLLASAEP